MKYIELLWERLEEGLVVLLLSLMTLITFTYVLLNNLYTIFYDAADLFPFAENVMFFIGDFILGLAQEMTWSIALTKALFAWLIFFGISYTVRLGANIGVDIVIRLVPVSMKRYMGIIVCLLCIGYAVLFAFASYSWVYAMMEADVGAADLRRYGIMQWHIAIIVPIGFSLVFLRLLQVLYRIVRCEQLGMELSNEASDALKLKNENGQESNL